MVDTYLQKCVACGVGFRSEKPYQSECPECSTRTVGCCVECGATDRATYSGETRERMLARSLCFYCLFWFDRIDAQSNPAACIVNGRSFQDAGRRSGRDLSLLGFGGREFRIEFFDGRVLETNNLFGQGEVPERFRDRLPDTARFGEVAR